MKGQGQVRIDSTIYQYVRKTDRTQQVSAKTNFYKTVLSQEDVMSSMLSSFYEIEKVEEVVESDNTIYRMTLNAKEKRSSYATIVADIDSETYLPIKRLYYSYSGQLVKEFLIEEIKKNENGELDFVRFKVTDMIKPQYYSIVIMDQFDTTYEIPENMFSVPYLKTHVK